MDRRNAVAAGFAALRHGKVILLLAVTTAVLGVSGAMPLLPAFQRSLAGTLAGDHFIRNAPTLAPTDFFDLLRENRAAFSGAWQAAGWVGFLGLLLQMFFAGGIVAVLGRGPFSFSQFLEPARRNFWHNVKCFLFFAILCLIVLGLWFGEGAATKKLFENAPPDATIRSVTRWSSIVVEALLFAILSLLYDFARAARRHSPTIGAFRSFRFAWRALSRSWLRALGLWIFWFATGGTALVALFAATWAMPAVSRPAIALLFLVQLGVIGARSAVRVAAWGSYLAFLDPRARPALTAIAKVTYTVAAPAPAASS